jgi:uncharacterized membrane protein YfcA
VSAAYLGTALVHRISERFLERMILVLLVMIVSAFRIFRDRRPLETPPAD